MVSCARSSAGTGASGGRSLSSARMNSTAATSWPDTFATAEPTSPSAGTPPRPYTSTGQAIADSPLPSSTMRIGRAVSCTPRIQPLPASVTSTSGAPGRAIRSQLSAASDTGPGPPASALATGPATSSPTSSSTAPTPSASQVDCTPSPTASARRPAPCSRAARAVVP
jgi:hypothetical protein